MAGKVGFVGLGLMGRPMAENLMRAGHELVLYNRTREKAEALAKGGKAEVAGSPGEVAEGSGAVKKGADTNLDRFVGCEKFVS